MKLLCDSNVLIALAVEQHVHHPVAARWFQTIAPTDQILLCRAVELSFLRLLTLKIAPDYHPATNSEAIDVLRRLQADEAVSPIAEPPELQARWPQLANRDTASPKVWMDSYLAAFALASDLRLVTFDHDFAAYRSHGLDLLLLSA